MVDRGSDFISSQRDSEKADTVFNVEIGKHEFSLVEPTVNKLVRVVGRMGYTSSLRISALAAKTSVIVMSTQATS